MTTGQHQLAMLQGEPIAQQGGRLLTGWLSREEAVKFLLGGRSPAPNEDLSAIDARTHAARVALADRPPFTPQNPIVAAENRTELDAAAARPKIHASFASMSWRIEMVDLRQVQALQKLIKTDGLEARIEPVKNGTTSLVDFCLPTTQPEPPHGTFADVDGKGFTISSLNPNLRIAGGQTSRADVATSAGSPTVPMMALTILVFLGSELSAGGVIITTATSSVTDTTVRPRLYKPESMSYRASSLKLPALSK